MSHTYLVDTFPALPFGDRTSITDDAAQNIVQKLRFVDPGIHACVSLAPDEFSIHRTSALSIRSTRILATATTPLRICSEQSSTYRLIIPFVGKINLVADSLTLNCQAGMTAAFIPPVSLVAETTLASFMTINVDCTRLEQVTRTMLGVYSPSPFGLALNVPRTLSLQVGRVSFEIMFRLLAITLDQFSYEPELLDITGLEDCFYRHIAMLLEPNLFLKQVHSKTNPAFSRRKIDRVCDYAVSRLHQTITLTELEHIGRMSKRSLHYAFQSRFGCTPLQWVRQERLMLARSQIHNAKNSSSITSIAISCGFNKPARFADYYNRHFGELPSVTLARVAVAR